MLVPVNTFAGRGEFDYIVRHSDAALLLRTEMEAGHGGGSARTKRYEEVAFAYAFMLDQVGITQ